MAIIVERSIYTSGTLIRVRSNPASSDAIEFHGNVGIITKTPISPGCLYEVAIGDQFIWLLQSEMDIVKEHYRILV